MIEVRRLARDELDRVIQGIGSRPPEVHRRRLETADRGGFVYLCGWLDGWPAGSVCLWVGLGSSPEESVEGRGFAKIIDLHVEQPFRRRGVARALMGEVEDEAARAGMTGVILDTGTSDDFAPTRELYRSLGYTELGGVFLGGWSDPHQPGEHYVDPLTIWLKELSVP